MPTAGESKRRTLTFVVGSGRSGTSTLAVTLKTLGMHVPTPEVPSDDTNPKGFGETQWVVDVHNRLLRQANVQTSDARPGAWFDVGKLAVQDQPRDEVYTWLKKQFAAGGDELLIKDPRLAWFLGLWKAAALHCDARPVYLTMLRPVTEVVGSKQHYYPAGQFGELNRVAGWVNMMLHTERATRGTDRGFLRYHDLLTDWTGPVRSVGERLQLDAVTQANANAIRRVHNFIDPDLRRIQATWDDMNVPRGLREVADETWAALNAIADDPAGDVEGSKLQKTLDDLRAEYTQIYGEAEAIAQSSTVAARRNGQRTGQNSGGGRAGAAARPLVERLARRVPAKVRARIPSTARKRVKSLAKRVLNR